MANTQAILGWFRRTARAAVLLACGVLAAGRANAQTQQRITPLDMNSLAGALVDASAGVSSAAFVAAYQAYLDDFEKLYVHMDADLARIREQARSAPGAFLSVRDATRTLEVWERAHKEHAALRGQLIERLKASAPAERAATLDVVGALLECQDLVRRQYTRGAPQDIAQYVQVSTQGLGTDDVWKQNAETIERESRRDTATARAAAFASRTANVQGRIRAYQAFAKADAELQLALAKRVEDMGAVGKTMQELQREINRGWASLNSSRDQATIVAEQRRLMQASQDLQALYHGVSAGSKEWAAVVREQYAAFKSAEHTLTPEQLADLHDRWMPTLVGVWYSTQVQTPDHRWVETPRELVRELLRLQDLTDEQRSALRKLGRSLIAETRATMRKAVEAAAAADPQASSAAISYDAMNKRVAEIGKAIGVPDLIDADGNGTFPKGPLADSLSPEDAEEFGFVAPKPEMTTAYRRTWARTALLPVPYDDEAAGMLIQRAGVAEAMQPIVHALVADARERWDAQVKPLVDASEPKYVPGSSSEAWREETERALDSRARAFQAAAECDRQLFEGLAAALVGVDPQLLRLIEVDGRLAECSPASWVASDANPVNVSRAVLDAPVSPASRAALAKEIAPTAEQWFALASQWLKDRLAQMNIDQSGDRHRVEYEPTDSAVRKRVEDADQQSKRAQAAWKAAEVAALQRMEALLAASEAAAWSAWIHRMQWPRFYPELTELRTQVDRALSGAPDEPALRTRTTEILAESESSIQRTGDLLRGIASASSAQTPDWQEWGPSRQELYQRLQPLMMANGWRVHLAAERVRLALPPELAPRITTGRALARLTAPPAPPSPSSPTQAPASPSAQPSGSTPSAQPTTAATGETP